jgi:DNA-directed RNA polymerase subunit RPC12/RpoP
VQGEIMIAIKCTCGAKLQSPEKFAGKKVKCPKCNALVLVGVPPRDAVPQTSKATTTTVVPPAPPRVVPPPLAPPPPIAQPIAQQVAPAQYHAPQPQQANSPQSNVNSLTTISAILIGGVCLLSLIPVLGFLSWIIASPVLFITSIMGIVTLAKGGAAEGALILLASLIAAPIFVLVAPFVSSFLVALLST